MVNTILNTVEEKKRIVAFFNLITIGWQSPSETAFFNLTGCHFLLDNISFDGSLHLRNVDPIPETRF